MDKRSYQVVLLTNFRCGWGERGGSLRFLFNVMFQARNQRAVGRNLSFKAIFIPTTAPPAPLHHPPPLVNA